jgi:hypothetical protein
MAHLRIPNTVVIGPRHRYRFSGEEILIIYLTWFATGDPWTRLIPSHFGGDQRRWSVAFCWLLIIFFVLFYHKISGRSIEGWIDQIHEFKKSILGHLAKPAHLFEVEFNNELAHPGFIIQCPIDSWRVFSFSDDLNVWTSRPGSGPVGNRDAPGRPRQQFADLIQRAFYEWFEVSNHFISKWNGHRIRLRKIGKSQLYLERVHKLRKYLTYVLIQRGFDFA